MAAPQWRTRRITHVHVIAIRRPVSAVQSPQISQRFVFDCWESCFRSCILAVGIGSADLGIPVDSPEWRDNHAEGVLKVGWRVGGVYAAISMKERIMRRSSVCAAMLGLMALVGQAVADPLFPEAQLGEPQPVLRAPQ